MQFLTSFSIEDMFDWSHLSGWKGYVVNIMSPYLLAQVCYFLSLLVHPGKVTACYLPVLWRKGTFSIIIIKWRVNYSQSVTSHSYSLNSQNIKHLSELQIKGAHASESLTTIHLWQPWCTPKQLHFLPKALHSLCVYNTCERWSNNIIYSLQFARFPNKSSLLTQLLVLKSLT